MSKDGEDVSTKLNASSNENYMLYATIWQVVLFIPFQYLVQVSCILTVLLSASRMIAVVKPLHVISERVVWASLILVMIFSLGTAIGKWFVLLKTEFPMNFIYTVQIETIETITIGISIVIVAVCSSMTVKSLKAPTAIGEMPNVSQGDTQNRRATVMILILSLAFILINGSWIAIMLITKDRPGSLFQPGPGPGPGSAKSAGTGILPGPGL